MKKIILAVLTAALVLMSLAACSSETKDAEDKEVTITPIDPITGETLPGDGDYIWEVVDSQIFAPDGTPVETMPEYQKINENAAVQNLSDITGLKDIIAGYETCYNYDLSYDESIIYSGDGNYYLVTDDEAAQKYRSECAKYFEEGRYPACVIDKSGALYYKPVDHDITLTIDLGEDGTGLNYSEENTCEISCTDTLGRHHTIELTKGEEGFKISYTTVE